MLQAQPLSILAPEYSDQLVPRQPLSTTQVTVKQTIVDAEIVKPACLIKKECCPAKPICPVEPKKCCPKLACPVEPKKCCPPVEVKKCCPPPKPVCPKPIDPCCVQKACDPCDGYGWKWLGALILWFIIFTVLFWLIFYSLKPPFVLQSDSNQVDTAKVLLAAVIAALILVIIIWLIKVAVGRY